MTRHADHIVDTTCAARVGSEVGWRAVLAPPIGKAEHVLVNVAYWGIEPVLVDASGLLTVRIHPLDLAGARIDTRRGYVGVCGPGEALEDAVARLNDGTSGAARTLQTNAT